MERRRGAGEMAPLGDGHEVLQLVELDGSILGPPIAAGYEFQSHHVLAFSTGRP